MIATNEIKRPATMYYGGKWRLAPWIISHFPAHRSYVEPCGGVASVLLRKPISPLETFNDLDKNVVNFFRVARENPAELIRQLELTPYSRHELELASTVSDDSTENARRFFVSCWVGISSAPYDKATGFCSSSYHGQRRVSHPRSFRDGAAALDDVAKRFRYVQIENRPAEYVIQRYDDADALIYFDPPYVTDTRKQKKQYALEVDNQFHIDVAELLRSAAGYVIVSGYACPLCAELYEAYGWSRVDKESQTNSGGKRIESLWLSPRTWKALNKPEQLRLI